MKKIYCVIFLVIGSLQLHAQAKIDIQVETITPYQIAEVTLEREAFFQWTNKVREIIKEQLSAKKDSLELKILCTFKTEGEPLIEISAKNSFSEQQRKELIAKIRTVALINTRVTDYSYILNVIVNGEISDEYADFSPKLIMPLQREMIHFDQLSLVEKRKAFRSWIFKEVIPVIVFHTVSVEEKYKGIRSVGNLLYEQKFMRESVDSLTDINEAYWQAVLEMSKGNQLIQFAKACMHFSKEEFDKATRLMEVIKLFSDPESIPYFYFEEISGKMTLLNQALNQEILTGIQLSEDRKTKQAIKYLEVLRDDFPKSAWLNFELIKIDLNAIKSNSSRRSAWLKQQYKVFENDPLYPVDIRPSSAKEAYQFSRSKQVSTLFQMKDQVKYDLVSYADIALDLGDFAFAGQLYWYIHLYFSKETYNERDMQAHFLYCMQQLDHEEIISIFQGDYKEKFKSIAQERNQIMEKSEVYKFFKKGK